MSQGPVTAACETAVVSTATPKVSARTAPAVSSLRLRLDRRGRRAIRVLPCSWEVAGVGSPQGCSHRTRVTGNTSAPRGSLDLKRDCGVRERRDAHHYCPLTKGRQGFRRVNLRGWTNPLRVIDVTPSRTHSGRRDGGVSANNQDGE